VANQMDEPTILDQIRAAGPGSPFDPRSTVWTGSSLSRVVLPDGQAFVLKHLRPEHDWITRLSHGYGRVQHLWRSGVFAALDPVVEHGVVGVIEGHGAEALVMRDLTGSLNAPDCFLDREHVEALMAVLARFHTFAEGLEVAGLCSIAESANLMNPDLHRTDRGENRLEGGGDALQRGLDYLVSRAGGEAGEALAAYYGDIPGFEAAVLEATERPTLVHGDTRVENVGVAGGRLVAVDWGDLTLIGPREWDVVAFTVQAAEVHTGASVNEIRSLYERHAPQPLDDELLRLSWLRHFAGYGVANVGELAAAADDDARRRMKARLASNIEGFRNFY
jgi:hypothetical protein